MSAVILVLDTPYHAVTDARGAYRFSGVPSGAYRLHVFYDRCAPEALASLTAAVNVGGGNLEIAPITLVEDRPPALPHKNKYGNDYPADNNSPDYGIPQ